MKTLTPFSKAVITMVKKIPSGKVATYSQIARLTGSPHASRGVVWVLSASSETHKLPWHRVISVKGRIVFRLGSKNFREQKRRLCREKIGVSLIGEVDLLKYQWKKKVGVQRAPKSQPQMFR